METKNEKDFQKWVKEKNITILKSLENVDLSIGDIVTFTNEFGVKFENRKVLGFCKPEYGRCVYLSNDAYWFPVRPTSLTK
ncbi:hypothetical protein J2O02_18430 (plasmid) [Elizabethkingia anophelis]|uniref:hypothetical protein n=1 Tax=Elizabethkingia anophelis TaxID=1117645 RepID=UPI0020B6FDA0|nr:hypothetical protein [Elizabethkingia anophelis]UTG66800.1 hypothetical protein J2O02_18430 [Elizabethkingia anophelis]